jgi:hypothetical protein
MKTRNGFVSNSSSSSFVLLKDAITEEQKDMILNCEEWIDTFIKLEAQDEDYFDDEDLPGNLKDKFEYYDSDPWRLEEHEDYIFGETSMDNFSMGDYLEYIKINKKYLKWDDGYNDEPYQNQLEFINVMKKEYNRVIRKKKLKKINKNDK